MTQSAISISVPLLATREDLPAIARLQYQACAAHSGFSAIFPIPPTDGALTHLISQYEALLNDANASIIVVKDTQHGDIISYAVCNFIPLRSVTEVEEEMLNDIPFSAFPPDANIELGQTLIKNSVRKRNEIASECFGMGAPFCYLAAVGTNPNYQNLGAASRLIEWVVDQANNKKLPIYVESTPSALRLYLKFEFQEYDRLRLDLRPMKDGDHANICLIKPQHKT